MISNPILEAKYKAQKEMDEKANHDMNTYVENVHQIVMNLSHQYGLKIKYGKNLSQEQASKEKNED